MNSSRDMLQLVAELNTKRMPMVFDKWHRRLFGTRLQGPKNIKGLLDRMTDEERTAYETVRQLHWRYEQTKFHHKSQELRQLLFFCGFLIRLHADAQGAVARTPEIDIDKMSCQEHLPVDAYLVANQLVEQM